MARKVPISRVRSRMAIHMVFMMPVTTMAIRIVSSTSLRTLSTFSVHVRNETSSSQVVTSSFCPVQSSRATVWNFIQNGLGSASITAQPSFSSCPRRRAAMAVTLGTNCGLR